MSKQMTTRELEAAIRANKRYLALLDREIAEASLVDPDLLVGLDPDQMLPFQYSAIDGLDDLVGVNVDVDTEETRSAPQGVSTPYYGFIRTDGDAAFVCTRLSAYVRTDANLYGTGAIDMFHPASDVINEFGLGVRLIDDTNDRRLSLSYDRQGTAQRSAIIPLDLIGQSSFGSVGGLSNPAQSTFARNSTIRVEVFSTSIDSDNAISVSTMRVHVIMHGYKVIGG